MPKAGLQGWLSGQRPPRTTTHSRRQPSAAELQASHVIKAASGMKAIGPPKF